MLGAKPSPHRYAYILGLLDSIKSTCRKANRGAEPETEMKTQHQSASERSEDGDGVVYLVHHTMLRNRG